MFDVRHLPLIAYGILVLLAVALAIEPPDDSGDMAAWVQGVGTLLAVAVAAGVGVLPIIAAARRDDIKRAQFLFALSEVSTMVERDTRGVRRAVDARSERDLNVELRNLRGACITAGLKRLLELPPDTWPNMALLNQAHRIDSGMDSLLNGPEGPFDPRLIEQNRTALGLQDAFWGEKANHLRQARSAAMIVMKATTLEIARQGGMNA